MTWTDGDISTLRALWASGRTASEIAAALNGPAGGRRSRNSVIGQAHRLGLSGRQARGNGLVRTLCAAPPRVPKPATGPKPPKPVHVGPDLARIVAGSPPPAPAVPTTEACALIDLTPRRCRYPVGEAVGAAQLFCGAAPAVADVYCPAHRRLAGGARLDQPAGKRRARGAA